MNIQEIRLRLAQQALDRGVHPELIPQKVEPLAQFVWRGLDSSARVKKGAKEKPVALLLKALRDRFGDQNALGVHVGAGGEVFVLVSNVDTSISIKEFLKIQSPSAFRGRKFKIWIEPPKKP